MIANDERFKKLAGVFKALSHPTRLFIVEELVMGERCVCKLAEMADVDNSTLSRHLTVLRNAGIVRDEKRGLQVFYSLRMKCVLNFIACLDSHSDQPADGSQVCEL